MIWCACERLGILPPSVKPSWDDNGVQLQAMILEFDRLRAHEESEWEAKLAGARTPQA